MPTRPASPPAKTPPAPSQAPPEAASPTPSQAAPREPGNGTSGLWPAQAPRSKPGHIKTLPPLSALTYYKRNIWRTLPIGGSIVLSVFLIASIVTLLSSVDRSITTTYGFTRHFSVLATQLIQEVPPRVQQRARAVPEVGRVAVAIPIVRSLKTVFGQIPVPIYGLEPADITRVLEVTGNHLAAGGRFPRAGEPEVILSRAWANNYGVGVGGLIGPGEDNLPTLKAKQRVVGILDGGDNIALADKDYLLLVLPEVVVRPTLLLIPRSPTQMKAMNTAVQSIVDSPTKHRLLAGEVANVKFYTFIDLVRQLRKATGFLYEFLSIADALVIGAVGLLSGFLANIYFEQRLGEFGLLAAFGFRRERLARRVIVETGSLVLIGWALGLLLSLGAFELLDAVYMRPRGLVLARPDATALLYTAPIPLLVGMASLATVLSRLYRLDPIEIMERR